MSKFTDYYRIEEGKKDCFSAVVYSQEQIAKNVMSLWIEAPVIAMTAYAGQFVNLYVRNQAKLLPRPFAICAIAHSLGRIRVVYKVNGHGTGTDELSYLTAGDRLNITGPHGRPFPIFNKDALIIAGGMGIAPMVELGSVIRETFGLKPKFALGYATNDIFLADDLMKYGNIFVATDDGTAGDKGTALDIVNNLQLDGDVIYACGPTPMLRAVKQLAIERDVPCFVSLEGRMGCGLGACLSCVVKTVEEDSHSKVHNARVCKEGPVFECREVEI